MVPALALLMAVGVAGSARAGKMDKLAEKGPAMGNDQQPVELNGDVMEYKADEGKFVASGNVVLRQGTSTLYCDHVEFFRDRQEAHADGNVIFESDKGSIWADKAFYNFKTKKGEFANARIIADPMYGRAETISKIRDGYYVMANGYLTTSDYDDPEWRMTSHQMELYPGDKAIARNSTMYLGGVPIMYMPKYVQDLHKNRPHLSVVPGYSKNWGGFVLTSYRVYPMTGVETVYHLDLRERKGAGYGLDIGLSPAHYGSSWIRTYYLNERTPGAHHIWESSTAPTVVERRYRVEWRHKWDIDPQTSAVIQYYVLSDSQILKDYFLREYRTDQNPTTFALFTHTTESSSFAVRADKRVNRFETTVERLPEVSYNWNNQPIGDTGFYFKSTNDVVQLDQRTPGATDRDHQTVRLLTEDELSRPFKLAFLEFRPFVGTEQTYYTRALNELNNDRVRGIFLTGTDISTKFYRIYDIHFNALGIEVNKLRHVVTPTVTYLYSHRPTMSSDDFYQFDSVDARAQIDKFSYGLENKLQTKRKDKDGNIENVDLFRSLLTTEFRLKDDPAGTSFNDVKLDNEFHVNKYVSLAHDLTYDPILNHLSSANVDITLTDTRKWTFNLSRRYLWNDDDIVTSQLAYKFNPKWKAVIYERMDVNTGGWQEQQYALVRDLHSWEMELSTNHKNMAGSKGNTIWVIFRLKAFPSVKFDGGDSFHETKRGPNG